MLLAGICRSEITPPPGCPLVGYAERPREGNAGVLDPLFATVLALKSGDDAPVLLVVLDLCLLENDVADWLRAELASRVSVPADRVVLSCSHTHSGPLLRPACLPEPPKSIPQIGTAGRAEEAYADVLRSVLVEACWQAVNGLRPARMAWRQGHLDLGYNRRSPDGSGGVRHCWNIRQFPDRVPQPLADATVSLLQFAFERGEPRAVNWFAAPFHPVVMGKESDRVSADWPGAARAMMERELPGSLAFFTPDAGGEAHPWIATQADASALSRVGAAVASPLILWADSLPQPEPVDILAWREERIGLGGAVLPLGVLRIGPVAAVFLPLELFGTLGCELRRKWRAPLIISTLSNGWEAYWPDRKAFEEGGYEVDIAKHFGRRPDDGERLVQSVLDLLAAVFGDAPGK